MKLTQKALCLAITDSEFFRNISAGKVRSTPVQAIIVADLIGKEIAMSLARRGYNYHLPNFTCTSKITL